MKLWWYGFGIIEGKILPTKQCRCSGNIDTTFLCYERRVSSHEANLSISICAFILCLSSSSTSAHFLYLFTAASSEKPLSDISTEHNLPPSTLSKYPDISMISILLPLKPPRRLYRDDIWYFLHHRSCVYNAMRDIRWLAVPTARWMSL